MFEKVVLLKCGVWSGAKMCTSCRTWKLLSNAYFLATFRFDTAENEPAKNLQNFAKKLLIFSQKKNTGASLRQREELFLSEISVELERCPENSELFLNSCSSAEYSRFLVDLWKNRIFEILQYFSEYFSKKDSKNISQIFSWRTLEHRSHFGSRCSEFSLPPTPAHNCELEEGRGARIWASQNFLVTSGPQVGRLGTVGTARQGD